MKTNGPSRTIQAEFTVDLDKETDSATVRYSVNGHIDEVRGGWWRPRMAEALEEAARSTRNGL